MIIVVTSTTQRAVLEYVRQRREVISLFQLAVDLGLDYSHAWRVVNRLERYGLLDVTRKGPGRPLVIRFRVGGHYDVNP